MNKKPIAARLLFSVASLCSGLLLMASASAAPAFTITGIADEAVMENVFYSSAAPVINGTVSGAVVYTQQLAFILLLSPTSCGLNFAEQINIMLNEDSDLFTIDSSNGIVSLDAQDYENPQDKGLNNIYSITLFAIDSDTNCSYLKWDVEILDQPPLSFALTGLGNKSLYENTSYTSPTPGISGATVGNVVYSLSGDDAAVFSFNSATGILQLDKQDFENPADANGDNIYEVTLTGIDEDANTASFSWTVTILNLPPLTFSLAPIAADVNEHHTWTSPAPAVSGAFRSPLQYTLGGDDARLFTLNVNGSTNLAGQNYEMPLDANADNIYIATLTATDSDGNTATTTISISILDTPFDPEIDSDGDGVINMVEIAENTDPYNAASFKDTDNDVIPDAVDSDADSDTLLNIDDNGGLAAYADHDHDYVPDYLDADDRGDDSSASCSDNNADLICDMYLALDPLFDRDQDSKPNHADIDSDNDLLPDVMEGLVDSDADSRTDHMDLDSDNDGIPDIVESDTYGLDGNGNGIADRFDVLVSGGTDSNHDGIDDNVTAPDFDDDGIPNYLDTDADHDLIPDALEGSSSSDHDGDDIDNLYDHDLTGGLDNNNDGINDSFPAPDTDGDSKKDYVDPDSDGDGIGDIVESGSYAVDTNTNDIDDRFDAAASVGIDSNNDGILEDRFPDMDGDGAVNHRDLDADNDTLTDVLECAGTDNDFNGIHDNFTLIALPLPDSDADNVPDCLDTDSNNDTIFDIHTTGSATFDIDANGMVDPTADPDHDGIDNTVDSAPSQYGLAPIDSDTDGVPDSVDNDNDNDSISNIVEGKADGDGDGIPNDLDLDSDNDGITDFIEAAVPPRSGDGNHNGVDDSVDASITGDMDANVDSIADIYDPVDTDGDGTTDFTDSDSDDDNLADHQEILAPALSGDDTDSDGIDNAFDINISGGADDNQDGVDDLLVFLLDNDSDGTPDYRDRDSDNDGISGKVEMTIDSDNDGISNFLDRDSDNDGLGDIIESGFPLPIGDLNNNGMDDSIDAVVTGGMDANHDGVDDIFLLADNDQDSIHDYLDSDSDNDGVSDREETSAVDLSGIDSDADGIDDAFDIDIVGGADANNDGIADAVAIVVDTDNDGQPNQFDTDSDNDGFLDGQENDDINHDGIPDRLQADGKVKSSSGSGSSGLTLFSLLAVVLSRTLRRHRLACVFLLTALLPFATNTFADDGGGMVIDQRVCREYTLLPSSDKGFARCFYVGAGLGITSLEPDTSDSSWRVADDADTGFSVYAGYHFARDWFTEIAYAGLGQAELDNRHVLVTAQEAVKYQAFALFAGYYLPLQHWFDASIPVNFFIKAGPAYLGSEASGKLVQLQEDSQTLLAAGAGIEWPFRKDWMLRAEVNSFSSEVTYMNVSVAWWFGAQPRRYKFPEPVPAATPVIQDDSAATSMTTEPAPERRTVTLPIPEVSYDNGPADTDSDGVDNRLDECPNTPANTRVDKKGCASYKGYIQSLYGAFNSTDLTYPSYGAMDTIILLLKSYPDTRIEIQAHTDDRGTTAFNQKLSEQRADVVKQYLVEKGIDASRIEANGYGESQPLGSNETAEGRSKNRRIDFVILNR